MRRLLISILLTFLSVTTTFATDYVLILGGAGGEKSYYDQFWSATSRFHQLLTQEYGLSPEQITFLFEDEGTTPGLVTGQSKREPILTAFGQLAERVQPTDRFILFMLGHASRTTSGVTFNLIGRDITQAEYTENINNIRAEQQLLIFGFPYSAIIVKEISAPGRVIITSSSPREGYASQAGFGDLFVDAFSEPNADNNKDGAISLLETFLWMQTRIEEWYAQDGARQAEHPHLDDNGDGRASRRDLEANSEGTLAEKTFLGNRLTPLPIPESTPLQNPEGSNDEPVEQLTPENESDNTEERSDTNDQVGIKGKSSLPYTFITEDDEHAIRKSIENAPSEPEHLDEGAVVLWETEIYDIDEDSRHVYSTRRIVKLFNKDGFHFGEIRIPYTLGGDDVTVHFARTIQPDGTTVELDQRRIVRGITPLSAAEAGLDVDMRFMYFEMPKMSDGSIIDYAYSTRNPPHVMKGEFWQQVYYQAEVPVQYYRLTTHVPKKMRMLHQVSGLSITPTITENNYIRTYTFEAKGVPALRREPFMPAVSDTAYSISLSSVDTWDKLAVWYATLIREQDRTTQEIEVKTKEILFGALTRNEKIKRLYEFVARNIQYAGDERGIWAIKPYPAAEVLKKEWGDCKGKSTLLSTMLRVAGIDSYPVLISAGKASRINREVPSLAYFNHMILAVDGGKNKDLIWLDPTVHTCAFGDFPVSDQNRWTLIINTDAPINKSNSEGSSNTVLSDEKKLDGTDVKNRLYTFQMTPAFPADSNLRRTTTQVKVRNDLSVEVTHELLVSGDFNSKIRARLLGVSHSEERIQFLHDLFELDERAKIEDFKISDILELKKDLKISFTWSCVDYMYKIGEQYILELPVVKHPYAKLLSDEEREHPVYLGKTLTLEDKITVDVQTPFVIQAVPESKKLQNSVAEILLDYKQSDRKAEMKQTIRFHTPTVDVSKYIQLTDIVKIAANQSIKHILVIQKP